MSRETSRAGTNGAGGSVDRRTFLTGAAALAGAAAVGQGVWTEGRSARERRRNVVLLIPDGSSRAHDTAARYLRAYRRDREAYPENVPDVELAVDRAEATGYVSTFPEDPDSTVTDSAAAGTAMATGEKTDAGAVAVDGDGEPLPTILEAANEAGYATGLVTTTQLTHATPAAFAAHVPDRGMQAEIARQYVAESDVDVFLGGDRSQFRPEGRDDGRDLIERARQRGYRYVETASELESVSEGPVLGLFTESGHLDYYLDRANDEDATQPGLPQMTETAIDLLEARSDEGFFLLVEGGRIDHASHGNDPAAIPEQLEYDRAVDAAMDYARDGPRRAATLVVSAADHVTGDLGIDYDADFGVIDDLAASQGRLTAAIEASSSTAEITAILEDRAGIDDPSDDELAALEADPSALTGPDGILNDRAGLVWGTDGHSGEDVPVYAAGERAERFSGSLDNTDFVDAFAAVLDLDGWGRSGRERGR